MKQLKKSLVAFFAMIGLALCSAPVFADVIDINEPVQTTQRSPLLYLIPCILIAIAVVILVLILRNRKKR